MYFIFYARYNKLQVIYTLFMILGTLYVVATPIGNLKDITLRALETLKIVDVIFAEDTRITQKLTQHYGLHVPIKHYDEHSPRSTMEDVVSRLQNGEQVALVTDAGTPGISDPGSVLVAGIQKELPGARIIAIPGPSALTAALSVSGLAANKFTFVGYPPLKNKRKKFFSNLKNIETRPVVLYESPHRLERTFHELEKIYNTSYQIFIAKELTKIYETNFHGSISEAMSYFKSDHGKGEFVIIVP